ncbi:MAG: VOC family protein [Gammaproteobacteria bacterium]
MAIQGLSHIGIGARDMAGALRFYRDLLGFEVVHEMKYDEIPEILRHPDRLARHAYYLRAGNVLLVIGTTTPPDGSPIMLDEVGNHHVAFWVDDIDAIHARLVGAGIRCIKEPLTFEPQNDSFSLGGGIRIRTAFYKDPNDIMVQLDQRIG